VSATPVPQELHRADDPAPDPEEIVRAILDCPMVSRMDGGRFGECVTYLPGRRVAGVVVRPGEITASVVGTSTSTAPALLGQIRAALAEVGAGCAVSVVFADIDVGDRDPVPLVR